MILRIYKHLLLPHLWKQTNLLRLNALSWLVVYFHFLSKHTHLWSSLHLLNPSFFLLFFFFPWSAGACLREHSYHYCGASWKRKTFLSLLYCVLWIKCNSLWQWHCHSECDILIQSFQVAITAYCHILHAAQSSIVKVHCQLSSQYAVFFFAVEWSASLRLRDASGRFHLYSFPLHLVGGMEIWKLPIVSNATSKNCLRKKKKMIFSFRVDNIYDLLDIDMIEHGAIKKFSTNYSVTS